MRNLCVPVMVLALACVLVACETPTGPDGADGNANVTQYIFGGHDFSSESTCSISLSDLGITEQEREESAWLVYLFYDGVVGVAPSYQVPGIGARGEEYSVELSTVVTPGLPQVLTIALENGTGDEYYEIRVIQIQASDMIDTTSAGFSAGGLIPEYLDVVNYRAVVDHYQIE